MLHDYVVKPDSLVISKQVAADQIKDNVSTTIPELVSKGVQAEIQKLDTMKRNEAMRYRLPYNVNTNSNPDFKSGSNVQFSYLRRMANTYPIARACINRRIRQITQLEWDVTTSDNIENEKGHESDIETVKDFLKRPMGSRSRMRKLLSIFVDDILTIDATCFEMQKSRGGDFMNLIPVDPTTIALRVTETGGTPEPPDPAYVQFIQGQKIAEFSTDEMLYDFMGNRSYSPYGLAPLESLLLQVESAIRGALWNLAYFKEGNVPEGFLTLPEEIAGNKERIEEWQMWFDAMVAGDPKFQHRLKLLPGGSEYTSAKKPEDMAFEKFEMWLLQQTCAVFDVPPQDIGITYQVNKATSETQADLSRERGLIPLGNFIKEFFDGLIQDELGYTNLQFIWHNINPVDRKEEVELAKMEIEMGARSIDEYRISQGDEPLGLKHYIVTPRGLIFVEDLIAGKFDSLGNLNPNLLEAAPKKDDKKDDDKSKKPKVSDDEEKEKMESSELRKWRKCIYKDLETGKPLRTRFPSDYIDPATHKTIEGALKKVGSKFQAKLVFDEYLDPQVKASLTLLGYSRELRKIEHEILSA